MTVHVVQSVGGAENASHQFTFGAAPTNGNLMICIMGHFQNGPSWGNGWTQLFTQSMSDWDVSAAYKYAGAGESATQTPLTSGSSTRDFYAWELTGVTGTIGTDIPHSNQHSTSNTSMTTSFSSTSFNTDANNQGVLGVLIADKTTTTFTAASLSGGHAPVTDGGGVIFDNRASQNRNTAAIMFHDYFATSGTAVQYTLSGVTPSAAFGTYSIIQVANFQPPSSTETATGVLSMSGISFNAAATEHHTLNAVLAFSGISFAGTAKDSHTGTGTLAFSGISFNSAGGPTNQTTGNLAFNGISFSAKEIEIETGTAKLAFQGISFNASGTRVESATGTLAFGGIAFHATGTRIESATGTLAFSGISISAFGLDAAGPGAGVRRFWTFE